VSSDHDDIRRDFGEAVNMTPAELSDDDFAHMRKVTGYVKRHRAQRPQQEDVEDSRWRYSLMNWGHGPLKN
jgi:hypothetical protein